MLITETNFASQTGELSVLVTRYAFEVLRLHLLTGRLMLELVVFANEGRAEGTLEHSASVTPHVPIALYTNGIDQRTHTSVSLQTLSGVADEALTEVTNGSDHLHPCGEGAHMLHHTVPSLHHTLCFTTAATHRQFVHSIAEVAVGSVLLFSAAFMALEHGVARLFRQRALNIPQLFLTLFLLLRFFSGTGFFLWHVTSSS